MITLSGEKGLIRVRSWSELEERPGFVSDLDPSQRKLASIIGRYVEKEKVRCGLSTCHTPHNRGYIVTTRDGHETNIGKDCGKRYFGVDFESQSRQFDRDITSAENRELLWNFSYTVEDLELSLKEKKEGEFGATWINTKIRSLKKTGNEVSATIVSALDSMAKRRISTLTKERRATDDEIDALEAAQGKTLPRPHFIEETIAEISGIDVLYPENDLRELVVLNLESQLKPFRELDIDSLTHEELKYWAKWIGEVPSMMERVEKAIHSGRALLVRNNLEPFVQLLSDRTEIKHFRQFLKRLAT